MYCALSGRSTVPEVDEGVVGTQCSRLIIKIILGQFTRRCICVLVAPHDSLHMQRRGINAEWRLLKFYQHHADKRVWPSATYFTIVHHPTSSPLTLSDRQPPTSPLFTTQLRHLSHCLTVSHLLHHCSPPNSVTSHTAYNSITPRQIVGTNLLTPKGWIAKLDRAHLHAYNLFRAYITWLNPKDRAGIEPRSTGPRLDSVSMNQLRRS